MINFPNRVYDPKAGGVFNVTGFVGEGGAQAGVTGIGLSAAQTYALVEFIVEHVEQCSWMQISRYMEAPMFNYYPPMSEEDMNTVRKLLLT